MLVAPGLSLPVFWPPLCGTGPCAGHADSEGRQARESRDPQLAPARSSLITASASAQVPETPTGLAAPARGAVRTIDYAPKQQGTDALSTSGSSSAARGTVTRPNPAASAAVVRVSAPATAAR